MNKAELIRVINDFFEGKTKSINLSTGDVRKKSAEVFKILQNKNIDWVLDTCEKLLEEMKWELGIIAYDWAFRVKNQYKRETFTIFERWLKTYIKGWGDCDDFCTHAFGYLMAKYNDLFPEVVKWTMDRNFCLRRAAAVVLIYPIKKNQINDINPFIISDRLMNDPHHLVQKGYGWMLKILSQFRKKDVFNYLQMNKDKMPRLSLRYAIEKMDEKERMLLMNKNT
jgi:3-methyladenine DNA glycosylase AlkD